MSNPLPNPIHRTASWGVWVSTSALCLAAFFLGFYLWWAITGRTDFRTELLSQLDVSQPVDAYSSWQFAVGTTLWMIVDLLGVWMLWKIRKLFVAIRWGGMFSSDTAQLLRSIGWIIFALGPLSVLSLAASCSVRNFFIARTGFSISIGIEDTDVYAMVIGLVIVALGHIMLEATRLNDENKAFV